MSLIPRDAAKAAIAAVDYIGDHLKRDLCKILDAIPAAEGEGKDAERYRYIRDALTQITNIKMDGQHSWRVQAIYTTGETFDEALDKTMVERPLCPCGQETDADGCPNGH